VIVVDASVVVTALADDGADGDELRRGLRGERLVAPHVIDLRSPRLGGGSPRPAPSTTGVPVWPSQIYSRSSWSVSPIAACWIAAGSCAPT